ncbi:MAG: DEAD/DEAH box helicase, partial [Methanoregulaceae archaeon]|nr:DEAD/DEAH box helicase [Methanoregulaceae archaeon]
MSDVFGSLHETLQQVLVNRLGWTDLREVQQQAYKAVNSGGDTLIIAPTAGGKTEAALIPVIDRILKNGASGLQCLYISPLKALINDQEERFLRFCQPTGLELQKWHGDVPKGDRVFRDGEPPNILMITPESLEVLLLDPVSAGAMKSLSAVIIDEVHAFVESLRGVQLRAVLDRIERVSGHGIQRIGLSATVGNPDEVLSWISGGKTLTGQVVQVPVPVTEKRFSFTMEPDPGRRMDAIARIVSGKKAIVFVGSRSEAEETMRALQGRLGHVA